LHSKKKILINHLKIIEIFIDCDNFSIEFENYLSKTSLPKSKHASNKPKICNSEIMTILMLYHMSGMKCFQYFYIHIAKKNLLDYFPNLPSYNRFVELEERVLMHLFVFVNTIRTGEETGISIVDSKHIKACHNRRIHQHKVFSGIAQRGKTSTGWFYGIKLFLIINSRGELIRANLTAGNIADNNFELLVKLFKNVKGLMIGDKGFLSSKVFQECYEHGLKIITKLRGNMKNKLMDMQEKLLLKKRGIIECIFDLLMTICDIDHTRHRNPKNAFCNIFAGLAAYSYLEKKPSIGSKYLKIN
jgi:hypothetical protein